MPTGRGTPRNIDEYIASFSPDVQPILEKIRSTIRQAAPGAQETISYKIPAFTLDGILVYFAAFKKHIGFYVPTPVIAEHRSELKDYEASGATVRFSLDRKLPVSLIKKLVKARLKMNAAKKQAS